MNKGITSDLRPTSSKRRSRLPPRIIPMRFWNGTPCIPWCGTILENGYGRIQIGEKRHRAHRLIYQGIKGPIPDGMTLDHLCRNRACVNPDHLEPVTAKTNTLRGEAVTAVNTRKTHCIRGHAFSGENLRIDVTTGGDTRRVCKSCEKARCARAWQRRKKRMHAAMKNSAEAKP